MNIAVFGRTAALVQAVRSELEQRGNAVVPTDAESLCNPETIHLYDAVIDATDLAALDADRRKAVANERKKLLEVLNGSPEVRFLYTGDSGRLYLDSRKDKTVSGSAEGTEADFVAGGPETAANWTCFTPALHFAADGVRTGKYVLARDVQILNPAGESFLSYADFAVAVAEELEKKRFVRSAFTAVSDTTAQQSAANWIDLSKGTMFKTRGAYFGILADNSGKKRSGMAYQSGKLVLSSRRGMVGDSPAVDSDLLYFYPMYEGRKVGYAIQFFPTELVLTTAYGAIRICYADDSLMYFKGENGLALCLEKNMRRNTCMKKRPGSAWEAVYPWRCSLLLNPLMGELEMKADWDAATLSTPVVRGCALPDENGNFLLSVEESVCAGHVRETYPTYEEGLRNTTENWETFLATIPALPPEFELVRLEAAWIEWSFLLKPSGLLKREHIVMTGAQFASSWQMVHNAAALHNNFPLARDLMLNMIDSIGPNGQFSDFIYDGKNLCQGIHPPAQGWGLQWLMRFHNLKEEMSHEDLTYLYEGYGRWANWFSTYRDDDRDGIPQFDFGDECGFDDSSVFVKEECVEGADLCSYMIALYDSLGDLAEMLERADEAKDWHSRADWLLNRMIELFWNGEKFISRRNMTHEVIDSNSITDYMPLILGKKLPQKIIDKMTADLTVEGDFLAFCGLTTEKMSSTQFRVAGFSRGFVLPPSNLMILTGMFAAGKEEEARMIAKRYCTAMIHSGVSMIMDPTEPAKATFTCTWPACAFLVLADMAYNQ